MALSAVCYNCINVIVTRVTILPVLSVLGAAAADNIQDKQGKANHSADGDDDVERREVAVFVLGEERIFLVVTPLFNNRHFHLLHSSANSNWGKQKTKM